MGKKDTMYTLLSSLDHKSQYPKIVAVISAITPTISRLRHTLCSVDLELSDSTMHNPGFVVKLKMESEVLNQFLDVAKVGSIVEMLDMKIVKNEGVVYGEIYDEDTVNLYNDNVTLVKWNSEADKYKISDKIKLTIKCLQQWKKANFSYSAEALLVSKESHSDVRRSRAGSSHASTTSPDKRMKLKDGSVDSSDSDVLSMKSPTRRKRQSEMNNLSSMSKRGKDSIETGSPSIHNKSTKKSIVISNVQSMESSKRKSSSDNIQELKLSSAKHVKTTPNYERTLRSSSNSPQKSSELSSNKTNEVSPLAESTPKSMKNKEISHSSELLKSKSTVDVRIRRSIGQPNKNGDIKNSFTDDSKGGNNKLKSAVSFHEVNKSKGNQALEKNKNKGDSSSKEFRNKTIVEDLSNLNEKILQTKKHEKKADSSDKEMYISKVKTLVRTRSNSSLTGKNKSSEKCVNITKNVKDTSLILDSEKGVNDTDNSLDVSKDRRTRQSKNSSTNSVELINKVISKTSNLSSAPEKKEKGSEIRTLLKSENETLCPKKSNSSIESSIGSVQKRKNRLLNSSDSSLDISSENSSVSLNLDLVAFKKCTIVEKSPASSKQNKKMKTSDNSMKDKSIEIIISTRDQSIEVIKEVKRTPGNVDKNRAVKEVKKNNQEATKEKDAFKRNKIKDMSRPTQAKGHKVHDDVLKKIQSKSPSGIDVKGSSSTDLHKGAGVNNHAQLGNKKNSPTIKSPIQRNKSPVSTNFRDDKQKQTRSSLSKMNEVRGQSSKSSKKKDGVFKYLESLTRDVLWRQAHLIDDISICDLEEIDTPEKFDLECKVISKFALIEDDIEVIRVQDGSLCPRGTLVIPHCPSWNDITDAILKNPTLKKNSPFVDIILFNSTRMDRTIISNEFYKILNVMAIKFQLKDDPRKGNIPKGELFFCAEGQNTHVVKLPKKTAQDIEERISKGMYKDSLQEKDVVAVEKSIVHTSLGELESLKDVREKNKPVRSLSNESQKRQLLDFKLDTQLQTSKILGKNREMEDEGNVASNDIEKEGRNSTDHEKNANRDENSKISTKVNQSASSDETMIDETPSIVRELSEIMHEESLLGLPFTPSEDVHLKNTGSEVTYSQFCGATKGKALNFRTSTQNESLSQNTVPIDVVKTSQCEEIDKMEPLIYCPSNSSESSAVEVLSSNHKNNVAQDKMESSPSVLQDEASRKGSEEILNSSQPKISSTETQNKNKNRNEISSDISSDSSINVISSNSSDLEIELIKHNNSSSQKKTKNEVSNFSNKETPNSKIQKYFQSQSLNKRSGNSKHGLTKKENVHPRKFTGEDGTNNYRGEEIVLSDNSSNASFFSVGSDNELAVSGKPVSASPCKRPRLVENEANDLHWYHVEENLQKIPDECLNQSAAKLPSLAQDELNSVYNDENNRVKFFSYSHDRTLPFLTADVIFTLGNTNCLTTTVTLINITPALKDISQESFIKSRCPSCHKLFNVYNTADNQSSVGEASTAALIIGSHIVCPDSECCNQILENPEFYFDVELKLKDGSQLKSAIGDKYGEDIFGCTAQEAVRNEGKFGQVLEVLKTISTNISCDKPVKVDFTRENICDPKSGPLYIKKIYL